MRTLHDDGETNDIIPRWPASITLSTTEPITQSYYVIRLGFKYGMLTRFNVH